MTGRIPWMPCTKGVAVREVLPGRQDLLTLNPKTASFRLPFTETLVFSEIGSSLVDVTAEQFDKYRSYLRFLARTQMPVHLRARLDPSDIVQQSLLQAYQAAEEFRGSSDAEMMAWLRKILAGVVAHTIRDQHRDRRDIFKEQAIQQRLDQSSVFLASAFIASDRPASAIIAQEDLMRGVAELVEQLPEAQRDAVILHYWQEIPLKQVAETLGKSPAAVAGLLQRGLATLREQANGKLQL